MTRVYAKTFREQTAVTAGVPGLIVAVGLIMADSILAVVGLLELPKPWGAVIGILVGTAVSILRLLKETEERPTVYANDLPAEVVVLRRNRSAGSP